MLKEIYTKEFLRSSPGSERVIDLDLKTEWKIKKIFLLITLPLPLGSLKRSDEQTFDSPGLQGGQKAFLQKLKFQFRWQVGSLSLCVCCSKRLKFTALNVGQYEVVWLYRPHRLNADSYFPEQTFYLQ